MTACEPIKPNLSRGLSVGAVRRLLPGWHADPLVATFSDDRKSFLTVWDFTPPPESDADPIRLTFVNYELEVWGSPVNTLPPFSANLMKK
jgi:hypothetical protein